MSEVIDLGKTPEFAIEEARETARITERLNYLREQIENECISYFEVYELQVMGDQGLIPDHELELRQWAGLPEFEEDDPIDPLQKTIFDGLMDIGWLQPRLSESDLAEIAEDIRVVIQGKFEVEGK